MRRSSRKTHRQQLPLPRHSERTTLVPEDNSWRDSIAMIEQDVRTCQRCMTTEIDLDLRGKPPQLELSLERDNEGRLGKVVLCRNGLHNLVREPLWHDHNGRGIATKEVTRESIYLEDGKLHSTPF
jgi:hypothetical protein